MEPILYAYTRKQALADGEQVALSDHPELKAMARQIYKHPVFFTRAVWDLVQMAVANEKELNDLKGVIWDILWMSTRNVIRRPNGATVVFRVKVTGVGRKLLYEMVAQVGPMDIDDPAPALTIMFPDED